MLSGAFLPAIFLPAAILLLGPAPARAEDRALAQRQVYREIVLLKSLEDLVERQDLARLSFIQRQTQQLHASIRSNGLGHVDTLRFSQALGVTWSYSGDFLRQIQMTRSEPVIAEIKSINALYFAERGLERPATSRLVATIFENLHQAMEQLNRLSIPDGLERKLNELRAPVGHVIARARQGDDAETYALATQAYRRILALYPDLNSVMSSNAAFASVMELQGLNELYGSVSREGRQP